MAESAVHVPVIEETPAYTHGDLTVTQTRVQTS